MAEEGWEFCQGNINRFGVFLAAVLSRQSPVPAAGGDTAVEHDQPLCSPSLKAQGSGPARIAACPAHSGVSVCSDPRGCRELCVLQLG